MKSFILVRDENTGTDIGRYVPHRQMAARNQCVYDPDK